MAAPTFTGTRLSSHGEFYKQQQVRGWRPTQCEVAALFGQGESAIPHLQHISVVVMARDAVGSPLVICMRVRKNAAPDGPDVTACTPQVTDCGNPRHLWDCVCAIDLKGLVTIIIDRCL